jgi:hypothetical protein
MIIIVLIVIVIVGFFFYGTTKGLRFEEECAAQIQEQYFKVKSVHISIGEARLRLRTIMDLVNFANEHGPDRRFLSIRTVRQSAVAINMLTLMGQELESVIPDYLVALKKRL